MDNNPTDPSQDGTGGAAPTEPNLGGTGGDTTGGSYTPPAPEPEAPAQAPEPVTVPDPNAGGENPGGGAPVL